MSDENGNCESCPNRYNTRKHRSDWPALIALAMILLFIVAMVKL